MRYRACKECWFGRLYRQGEEAEFASGTRVPEALFQPLDPAPASAGNLAGIRALRRRAKELGIAYGRGWSAADLGAAIAAADAGSGKEEARHGQ
jgi:hypothetical protein